METLGKLKKGQTPSLLETEQANKLIEAINYILKSEVHPPSIGRFKDSTAHRVLDLTGLETYVSDRVEESLQKMSVTAVCNGDGTITINVTYTGA